MRFQRLNLLRSFRRHAHAPGSHLAPPVWRRIEAGPLAGLVMFLNTGHGRSLSDRIVAGTYEPELLNAIRHLSARGGYLYDVGAHVGYVSCAWVHLGGAGAEAFEPVAANAQIVRHAAARNKLGSIRVHEIALADANTTARMRVNDANLSTSSMAYLENQGGVEERRDSLEYAVAQTIGVPVRALDDYVAEHALPPPSAIKIDVEGAEGHVIRGGLQTLKRYRPPILCELHNIESAVDVANQLAGLDYAPQLLFRQKQTICNYVWYSAPQPEPVPTGRQ
jgi:FkbM family methyltransferase